MIPTAPTLLLSLGLASTLLPSSRPTAEPAPALTGASSAGAPAGPQVDGPIPVDLLEHGLLDWSGDREYWRIEDGVLVGESTANNPLPRSTYLTWLGDEVADFDLTLEFRIRGGNSGIQFRGVQGPNHQVSGYQADLEEGPNWTGGLYEQDGRGIVCRRGQSVTLLPDRKSNVEALPNAEELETIVRKGDWNTYRMQAVGNRIELFLNGKQSAVIVDENPAEARKRGVLAFQLHQGPPMRIEYRNIMLQNGTGRLGSSLPARWITSGEESTWSELVFETPGGVRGMTLSGMFTGSGEVYLDGQPVTSSTEAATPFRVTKLPGLKAGNHRLLARCSGGGHGPAGVLLELTLHRASGDVRVITNRSWRVSPGEPEGWPDAMPGWGRPASILPVPAATGR